MVIISGIIVHISAFYLLGLGLLCFIRPTIAQHFFDLFAATKRAHFTEQAIRILVGFALILFSEKMRNTGIFSTFGWLIVVTSFLLIILPWQWHHQFAHWVIPYVKRYLKFYAVLSLLMAFIMFYSAWPPEDWLY